MQRFNNEVIREMIGVLKKLEQDRKVLAERPDFTLERAFDIITPHGGLDKIAQGDMVAQFNSLGVTCSTKDASLMIRRYDADFDGKISFWEFSNIFLPICPQARRKIEDRKVGAPPLTVETRAMIVNFLTRVVDAERTIEHIRNEAKRNGLSNLREVFDEFDWIQRGYLTT